MPPGEWCYQRHSPMGGPYYGGKAQWAEDVWARLGKVTVYVEPFAGSLAVLLASPPHQREIVCDTNGHICNFWRALRQDPEAVAYHADYPTFHQDLTARHTWLVQWAREHAALLPQDPDWYDPRAAGWWAWGISNWIGGGWCQDDTPGGQIPSVHPTGGGKGLQAQRVNLPDQIPHVNPRGGGKGLQSQRRTPPDQVPHMANTPGGRGVQAQRAELTGKPPYEKRPLAHQNGGGPGVSAQRLTIPEVPDKRPLLQLGTEVPIGSGDRLLDWFHALAQRLSRVVVLNRSWESALTPTLLMHTPSSPKPPVGIFLDPPYVTENREAVLYQSDASGTSDDTAEKAYLWAVQHGGVYRIAYACHEGDFPVPPGWEAIERSFRGIKRQDRREGAMDMVMFSPACLDQDHQLQMQLGEEA